MCFLLVESTGCDNDLFGCRFILISILIHLVAKLAENRTLSNDRLCKVQPWIVHSLRYGTNKQQINKKPCMLRLKWPLERYRLTQASERASTHCASHITTFGCLSRSNYFFVQFRRLVSSFVYVCVCVLLISALFICNVQWHCNRYVQSLFSSR